MTNRNLQSPIRAPLAALALALAVAGCHWRTPAERAAADIVEKNVAARGGLKAWRAVRSMSMAGKLEAGVPRDPVKLAMAYRRTTDQVKADARRAALGQSEAAAGTPVQLPFTMELERPRRSRLEVRFQGQTAVQVYDGEKGWKLRPFLGRREVEPYTAEELRVAGQQSDLDGLLIDHAAKGSKVELMGTEPVDGRPAHLLQVTLRGGQVRRVWVDAQTFLEVKVDGSRRLDGKLRPVWTSFRDYRSVQGLMIPHVLETTVEGVKGSEKILVDRVVVNPGLDDARFTRPN